jgi:hypothetical protein
MFHLYPSPSFAPAFLTAAVKLPKCAISLSHRKPCSRFDMNVFERDSHVVCGHVPCCRWLPTRVMRDCRFAPTAELDLHLYAIGCDIVCILSQFTIFFKRNHLFMRPTQPNCSYGMPPLGPPQVRRHLPSAVAHASVSVFDCVGSSLSLAKYLRPERLPAVFRSIDW